MILPIANTAPSPRYTRQSFNFDTLHRDTIQYLSRKSGKPWFRADSTKPVDGIERVVDFTFTDEMLLELIKTPHAFKKDMTAALGYGFIGHSNGGRNGIVTLRDEDVRFKRAVDSYVSRELFKIPVWDGHYACKTEGVKIVVHRKNGLRTIGIRDITHDQILFFDRMTYKY